MFVRKIQVPNSDLRLEFGKSFCCPTLSPGATWGFVWSPFIFSGLALLKRFGYSPLRRRFILKIFEKNKPESSKDIVANLEMLCIVEMQIFISTNVDFCWREIRAGQPFMLFAKVHAAARRRVGDGVMAKQNPLVGARGFCFAYYR